MWLKGLAALFHRQQVSYFLRPDRSQRTPIPSRVMRWANLAANQSGPGSSSWVCRKLADNKNGTLRRRRGTGSSRWLPLVVDEVKSSDN